MESLRNIWIICRKELGSYFVSPIAYILLGTFAIIFGWMFSSLLIYVVRAGMEAMMSGQPMPLNINDDIIRPVSSNVRVVELFLIPLVTMRLFSEEKNRGTIELLATSPVRDYEVILGKWLAALILFICAFAISLIDFVWLFKYGNPDWKPLLVVYLGLILETGALLAIGTFVSSLTRNQIIAGAVTFCVCLMLWILNWTTSFDNSTLSHVLGYLAVVTHFDSFSKGVIQLSDVIFYLTTTYLGLFLTSRSLESLRWRS